MDVKQFDNPERFYNCGAMRPFFVAVLIGSLTCGACGGATESKSDGAGDQNSSATVTEVASQAIFVEPTVDAARSLSVEITASRGGTVTLPLSSTVSVTLAVPPGAFATDQTITLSTVTSLGTEGEEVLGVDIQPSGAWFPVGAMPTLSFEGISNDSSVLGWDDDNVLSEMFVLPTSATGVTVALAHFSGAAVSGPLNPRTPLDELRSDIAADLRTEQFRQLSGSETDQQEWNDKWSKRVAEVRTKYVSKVLDDAAEGECGFGGYDAIRIALGLEQTAQLIGVMVEPDNDRLAKVISHEIDCARRQCESGSPTAFGRYLRAEQSAQMLGVEGKVDTYDPEDFAACSLFRVTVMGRSTLRTKLGDINEAFVAKGIVESEVSGGSQLLPMNVTVGGVASFDSAAMSGTYGQLPALFGGATVDVSCKSTPIGPSVAQVGVAMVPSANDPTIILPTITFKPFINPGSRDCLGYSVPETTWVIFASHMTMPNFVFSGSDLRHEFTAEERDSSRVFRAKGSIDMAKYLPAGLGGPSVLIMNVQPVAELQPPSGLQLSTSGLVDKYAEVAAS